MKKVLVSVLIIVVALSCFLTSCMVSKSDLAGTWVSDTFYYSKGGYYAYIHIEIDKDGTYTKTRYSSAGIAMETERGTVEIDGTEVRCTKANNSTKIVLEYKDGILTSGDRTYTKQ